eukprot:GFUD01015981.1.p1 GENE.GFUD01015981.1~~GFUD01015981.1.p1  ORF type:complete len:1877 (+),score=582.30 GFUD01015981.1:47-5677(+)
MRKIKTKAELKALGDQFPQPPPVEFEEPQRSILEPVFSCDICSQVFGCEEDLTNHEIKHMKLTCGLCNKNFKSKAAFEEHEKDHPSVEKMSTFKKIPVKIGKNKFECSVCKKKFKNETSLNYHEMFHTDDERKAADGIKVIPSQNVIKGQLNYRDFDSEDDDFDSPAKRKNKNKKVVRKRNTKTEAKKVVKVSHTNAPTNSKLQNMVKKIDSDETDDDSEFEISASKNVTLAQTDCKKVPSLPLKNNPTVPTGHSRPFSEISGDSDSESASCDSKYLSLKHISRSMKKTAKPMTVAKHYSSSSDDDNVSLKNPEKTIAGTNTVTIFKNTTDPKPNKILKKSFTEDNGNSLESQNNEQSQALVEDKTKKSSEDTNDCAPHLAISETESEGEVMRKPNETLKKTTSNIHEIEPYDVQSIITKKSASNSPKTLKRIKFSCEKCKKKFNDPMALEYHRITFHVEEDIASHSSSIDKEKVISSTSSLKGNKSQNKQELTQANKYGKSIPKSKEFLHSGSESDHNTPKTKKRKAAEKKCAPQKKQKVVESDKAKSKCLTGIFRKRKPSESSDDESQIKRYVNLSSSIILQPKRSTLKNKMHAPSSDSDEFVHNVKGNLNVKKQTLRTQTKKSLTKRKPKSGLKESAVVYKNETTDEEVFPLKHKVNPKILLPDEKMVESSSEFEDVPVNLRTGGFIDETTEDEMALVKNTDTAKNLSKKILPTADELKSKYNSDSSELEKVNIEAGLSLKEKKIICIGCGRAMASASTLAYHMIRCKGDFEKNKAKVFEVELKKDSKNKQSDNDKNADKKNKKAELKKGGDLKDIYTARSRKKIDYLEVSDFEESDENADANNDLKMNELKVAIKADTSSDESDFEVNKIVKKKVLKKKITKKKSDTSEEDSEESNDMIPKSNFLKKKTQKKKHDTQDEDLAEQSIDDSKLRLSNSLALNVFKKKTLLPKHDGISEQEEEEPPKTTKDSKNVLKTKSTAVAARMSLKRIESDMDKSSLDAILLSTDEDKSLKGFYKSEDSKSEETHFNFKNKKVNKLISKVTKNSEKMVTSDSEPEIVKKETVKTEMIEEKISESDGNETLSNKIREKLLSTKSEKVKCENCNKSLKNSVILQYHQLHCIVPKKSLSSSPNHLVEKKIISSKKSNLSESPVDMILKKLSEKVQNSATNSPNSSPNSVSSYKFFKTKNDEVKSPTHVPEILKAQNNKNLLDVKCQICGVFSDPKFILEHIKVCHDEKISVSVKKISKFDLNKYKSDTSDDDVEKSKAFDFCDDENSIPTQNDENTSRNINIDSQHNLSVDRTNLQSKRSSINETEETKKLQINNWKEITNDCKIPANFLELKTLKAKDNLSINNEEKKRNTIKKKKESACISDVVDSTESEPDTKISMKGRELNSKDYKSNKLNNAKDECESMIAKENKIVVRRSDSELSDHEVSLPAKIKLQNEESMRKKNSANDKGNCNAVNKRISSKGKQNKKLADISDISDDEIITPSKEEQKPESIDPTEKKLDLKKNHKPVAHEKHADDSNQSDEEKIIPEKDKMPVVDDEPVKKKKKSKKEKKKKSKKKSKKSKHKRHNSSSSDTEEEERKKKRKKKHRKQLDDSDVSESPALDTSNTSIEEDQEVKEKKETVSYCFCDKPESEDMIGCDFCDMWYHPDCLGLDEQQAVSLTKCDSWMCPECEDKKSNNNKRRKPQKPEEKQKQSTNADYKSTNKDKKQTTVKEKSLKGNASLKYVSKTSQEKKKSISKKYINDEDMTDSDEDISREPSPELGNDKESLKGKTFLQNKTAAKPNFKPPVETVESKSVKKIEKSGEDLQKCQGVRKGSELTKKPVTMSDSLSDSDEDASSLEESPSIIRIPMDASQLDQSYSSSEYE